MAHAGPGKLSGLITIQKAIILIYEMTCRDKPEFGPEMVKGDFRDLINPFNDDQVPGFTDLCTRFQHLYPQLGLPEIIGRGYKGSILFMIQAGIGRERRTQW